MIKKSEVQCCKREGIAALLDKIKHYSVKNNCNCAIRKKNKYVQNATQKSAHSYNLNDLNKVVV